MAELENVDLYSTVTLVDRVGTGGKDAEFVFNGKRFPFEDDDGQVVTEITVPQFVAEFLFTGTAAWKHQVWTPPTEGDAIGTRVNRYGIKQCSKKLIAQWGPEVADCSPIEIDRTVAEGSDAPLYRTGPVRVLPVNIPPNERARDRQGRRASIIAGER
jgi:hypothetical protein